ncbi:MAG: YggS family pyridoxal phosphate-dependent enzyme [Elusimicrobia bacterium]|nr:YggS family pyridoxal phosphate-dependent enzyme [Elusimicrobiota bacterium]
MTAAAARTNRDAGAIGLVAVTKYASLEAVREALSSGLVLEVGENRVQDAEEKKRELGSLASAVRWRLIGHLQTNKAKKAVRTFDAVDSVDSARLAAALDAASAGAGRELPVMIQVKLSERETQSGIAPAELPLLIEEVRRHRSLRLQGLMGIAPHAEPLEAVRPSFRLLRKLRDDHLPGGKLSMGMSRDFEIAIEEGADLVRIGSQIFAP